MRLYANSIQGKETNWTQVWLISSLFWNEGGDSQLANHSWNKDWEFRASASGFLRGKQGGHQCVLGQMGKEWFPAVSHFRNASARELHLLKYTLTSAFWLALRIGFTSLFFTVDDFNCYVMILNMAAWDKCWRRCGAHGKPLHCYGHIN